MLLAFVFFLGIADANAEIDSIAADKSLSQSVWTEIAGQRDKNTRQWEVTKWVETIDPRTQEVETTQVKSKVIEKGCGICYLDSNGQYQVSQIEWRDAGDAFVMDKANYQLVIGKTAGEYLNYFIDGECLQLRPRKLMAVSADKSEILSQINGSVEGCIDADNKNILTFKDAFGTGIDLQLEVYAGGYHQNVVFNNKLALPEGYDADTTSVKLYTEMGLNEYMASGKIKEAVVWNGGRDKARFSLDRAGIAAGESSGRIDGHIKFIDTDESGNSRTLHSFVDSDVYEEVTGSSGRSREKIATATKEIVNDGTGTFLVETLDAMVLTDSRGPVVWDYHTISSSLSQDEMWYADATYLVTSNISIFSGVTLKIEPGTVIKFQADKGIAVFGEMIAKGEPYSYITFTSSKDNTVGEAVDSGLPSIDDWGGIIYYSSTFPIDIEFCRFNYCEDAIWINDAPIDTSVQNNIFANTSNYGVFIKIMDDLDMVAVVANNLFANVERGVTVAFYNSQSVDCDVSIIGNTIDATSWGIWASDFNSSSGQTVEAFNNIILNTTYRGIEINGNEVTEHNNAFYNCSTTVYGGHDASDIDLPSSPFESGWTQLGEYYLNHDALGGNLIVNGGFGTVEDWYEEPSQWAVYHVPNDHIFAGSVNIEADVTLEPNDAVCDTDAVAIGYHHPRIDYLVYYAMIDRLNGLWSIDVEEGTVIAICDYAVFFTGFEAEGSFSNPVQIVNADYVGQHVTSNSWQLVFIDDAIFKDVEFRNHGPIEMSDYSTATRSCENCKFIGGNSSTGFTSANPMTLENCLFVNCFMGATCDSGSNVLTFVNCEFLRYEIAVYNPAEVRNCIFREGAAAIYGTGFSESHNAFYHNAIDSGGQMIDATDYSDQVTGLQLLTAVDFYDGWTDWNDRFYLPSASKLVDAGDPLDTPMLGYTTDLSGIEDNNTRDIGYHYVVPLGNVQVDIYPAEAIAAGAQWRLIKSTTSYVSEWKASGSTIQNIYEGSGYTIEFSDAVGYQTPADIDITIVAGTTVTESATYIVGIGSLQVFITEPSAARWNLTNSSPAYDSGYLEDGDNLTDIPVGDGYTISFTSISGYIKPADISLSIVQGDNGPYTRTYTPISTDIYVSLSGSDSTGNGSYSNPYRHISYAIAQASNGEVVIVRGSDVTFYESHLSFGGKSITVKSETRYGVTINALGYTSVFTFNTNETSNSKLEGFKLENGYSIEGSPLTGGGGIHIDNASPTISYCKIKECSANHGGGIYIMDGAPTISYCNISNCSAISGGGVYMEPNCYWGKLIGCTITENETTSNSNTSRGGGVVIMDGGRLEGCNITSNSCAHTQSREIWHAGAIECKFISNTVSGGCIVDDGEIVGPYVMSATGAYATD